ncbi:hypothetical protein MJO28_007981 [Puccinia striiformis f. sp. tritici]|uniref:Secreted protein n=4 Tax=Puccinia striiformis TaxID=27350 RepID=A0A0L0UXM3_9BASI|nr:hypothetical protein Pst134EA_015949 [Puccinia striiformis f. sp. tritici]KAI9602359.1 hypothetical protein H4Q26_001647 [Puccinia striiformis f. sp. tritici PST-130]KNE91780.1 hypothetical protein PSTG_14798 [Puccinia striiformis f. sp. tritici PST-78]POW04334.1 hypothetical protein PSHT_11241 [Puccinia striiformis]KAH9453089.1 hypothetical protein Pst134EB_017023 [Puccinia striiformis f. sp. tritici]KAH9463869.1 hypothetical protein Pst134EA_015949 [Puccinia striiformis f. sp. tritici]
MRFHLFHPIAIIVVFNAMVGRYCASLNGTVINYAKCSNNKIVPADEVVKCTLGDLTCSLIHGIGKPGILKCTDSSVEPQLIGNTECATRVVPECEFAMQKEGQLSKVL